MDFGFTEEQTDLRDLARKILEERVTNERLKQVEAERPVFDRELWDELARANLLGVAIPDEHGGMGFGFFELCLLLQEAGRAVAPVPAWPVLALGALPVAAFGSEEQKKRYLPWIAAGECVATAALAEADCDDPLDPGATAKRDGDAWRLEGEKTTVPAGPVAERILVPARAEDARIGLFWVEPGAPGVAVEAQETSSRQPHALLRLEGARVAESERLGDLDRGAEQLRWLVERAIVSLCAVQLGVSERQLEMTAEYTRERRQFDRPIGSFQAVHQRAGDAYIMVEAMRMSLWEAAWRLAEGLDASDAVRTAKYWAAEGGQFVAYGCTHLHGGVGIDVDYPLHRYFIWSTEIEHSFGGASAQLAKIGAGIARG